MKDSSYLKTAIKAAKAAGKIIRQNFGKHLDLHYKTGSDFVTNVDLDAEKRILSILKKRYQDHSFYSEEAGIEKQDSKFMWVIDPLDGTTNYTMANPFFNTSIALTKDGEIVLAVVYNPVLDELFTAEKGKGAFLNGSKIKVNTNRDISKSIVTFCHGSKKPEHVERIVKIYSKLKKKANHTRQMGAAALELAYVACGRTSVFCMSNMNAYDVSAGALLVKEAGGDVTDFKNKPFTISSVDILATNSVLHKELLSLIK